MSTTDTEAPTAASPLPQAAKTGIAPETYETALKGVESLWTWAEKKNVPKALLLELITEGEPGYGGEAEHVPPFHTVLAWFDIFDPNGVKIHATVREGASVAGLEQMLNVASLVATKLIEADAWRPVDRPSRTDAEVAETKAHAASSAADRAAPTAASAAAPSAEQEPTTGIRTIEVEEIVKVMTDTGSIRYVVRGFPWKQYGVSAWPDSGKIEKLGALVDLAKWKPGEKATFSAGQLSAIVALKPDGKPLKVLDWQGPDVLSDAECADPDPTPF